MKTIFLLTIFLFSAPIVLQAQDGGGQLFKTTPQPSPSPSPAVNQPPSGSASPSQTSAPGPGVVPPHDPNAQWIPNPNWVPPKTESTPQKISFMNYTKHLVTIEGDKGVGSGFIATFMGKPYLFTNTHVLSGNTKVKIRTLNGKEITMKGLSMADACDVSIILQEDVPTGAEIFRGMDEEVNIGDDVVVLGNSLGGGVVTEINGKVTGIGPDLIEVDAKFVPGNSGSPIIHMKTGKIIGIATYVSIRKMEGVGENSKFANVERYFGYRLDNINAWRNTTWPLFVKEAGTVNSIHTRTSEMWALAEDIAENGKITKLGEHLMRNNVVAPHVSEFQQAASKHGRSGVEYFNAKKKLIYWLSNELKKDLNNLNYSGFTQFHRKKIESDKEDRDILKRFFEHLDQGLRM